MLPNPEWERAHAATRAPESGSVFQSETYWRDRAAALEAELAAARDLISDAAAAVYMDDNGDLMITEKALIKRIGDFAGAALSGEADA